MAAETPYAVRRFKASAFWLSLWLAVPLVAGKAVHWGRPTADYSWKTWLQDIVVSSGADVAFVLGFGTAVFVVLTTLRRWPRVERVAGVAAVALGAFGAHGLNARLAPLADGAQRLDWWKTAAQYHLAHALALGLAAGLLGDTRAGRVACISFMCGIALFSGSLYTMTLTGVRVLGAVTPLGGLALMLGWGALAYAAFKP